MQPAGTVSSKSLFTAVAVAAATAARWFTMAALHIRGSEITAHQFKGLKELSAEGGRKVDLERTVIILDDAMGWLAALLLLYKQAVGSEL
jgi:hypothetical protein